MKLTDAFLRSIKAISKAQKHSDGGGLYLYVSPPGGKLWRMGSGVWTTVLKGSERL